MLVSFNFSIVFLLQSITDSFAIVKPSLTFSNTGNSFSNSAVDIGILIVFTNFKTYSQTLLNIEAILSPIKFNISAPEANSSIPLVAKPNKPAILVTMVPKLLKRDIKPGINLRGSVNAVTTIFKTENSPLNTFVTAEIVFSLNFNFSVNSLKPLVALNNC